MSDKDKAISIADDVVALWDNGEFEREDAEEIAAELRRQHEAIKALEAERDALRAFLIEGLSEESIEYVMGSDWVDKVRSIIDSASNAQLPEV